MKLITAGLVAVGLLAGASGAFAAERENVAFSIKTENVDFANPESVADFRRGLAQQIAAACNPGNRVGADLSPDFKCRKEMAASVEMKILRLVAEARGNHFANFN